MEAKTTGIELESNGYSAKRATVVFCDMHSKKNFANISKHDHSIICIDIHEFCSNVDFDFLITGVKISSKKFPIDQILNSNIIYFPYSFESLLFDPIKGDSRYRFAKRQYATLIFYLEHIFSSCLNTVNSPVMGRKWSNKPYQLENIAKFLPEYKISSTIKSNYIDSDINFVVKHLSESRLIDKTNVSLSIKMNEDIKNDLNLGSSLPYINQDFIDEMAEFRCYIFGNEFVLLKFLRHGLPNDIIDIHFEKNLSAIVFIDVVNIIHVEMIKKIVELTKLKIFSIDFFLTKQEGIKLLEINPLCSWYWLPKDIIFIINSAFINFIKTV